MCEENLNSRNAKANGLIIKELNNRIDLGDYAGTL